MARSPREKQPRFPGNNQAGVEILGTIYPLQDAKSLKKNRPTKPLPQGKLRALQESLRQAVHNHAAAIRFSLDHLAELDKRVWSNYLLPSAEELAVLLVSPITALATQLDAAGKAFRKLKDLKSDARSQAKREAAFAEIAASVHRIEDVLDNGASTGLQDVIEKPGIWAARLRKKLTSMRDFAELLVDYRTQTHWNNEGDELTVNLKDLTDELLAAMRQLHADERDPPNLAAAANAQSSALVCPLRPKGPVPHQAQAIALLADQRELTISQIAKMLGVERNTPYKWKTFLVAAERVGRYCPNKKPKEVPDVPRGSKKDGLVEAIDDDG